MTHARMIQTVRLEIVPASVAMLKADVERSPQLSTMLNAVVPPGWPPEEYAEALPMFLEELEVRPEVNGWWAYYWLKKADESPRTLIGSGGFRGCPSDDGTVELGYGILPEFQGRGYATEAAFAMVAYAFGHHRVECVIADTLGSNGPSRHVLEKLGFRLRGDGAEEGTVRYELPRTLWVARSKVY